MRKFTLLGVLILFAIAFISWGHKGHRIVATIANNHLTPQAKFAIKELLGGESLADVSTWADEVRIDAAYRKTANWHFLNVPLGLTYEQFTKSVSSLSNENILTAISNAENTLADKSTTKEQKREALKFLIHFVGDAHQPMHVSRAEDKGGSTIQLRFNNKGTNLHSLWDSGLIDHSGLSEEQLVAKIEKGIKPSDLIEYSKAKPMKWLYESYSTSTLLYKGLHQSKKIDERYFANNIVLVEERLGAAGLRLASILNEIFKVPIPSAPSTITITDVPPNVNVKFIESKDAYKHLGELVSITDTVYSSKDMGSMILVNLGAEYPNQKLTVVLRGEARVKAKEIESKTIRVEGKVMDYRGKPQIVITMPHAIEVIDIVGKSGTHGG